MTVKVSGHVIDRLTEKIVKNVNKTEIDHIGAYPSNYKHGKTQLLLFSAISVWFRRQKAQFKVWKEWRLFCFVLEATHFDVIGSFVEIGRFLTRSAVLSRSAMILAILMISAVLTISAVLMILAVLTISAESAILTSYVLALDRPF